MAVKFGLVWIRSGVLWQSGKVGYVMAESGLFWQSWSVGYVMVRKGVFRQSGYGELRCVREWIGKARNIKAVWVSHGLLWLGSLC